jgi:hypothetical protein
MKMSKIINNAPRWSWARYQLGNPSYNVALNQLKSEIQSVQNHDNPSTNPPMSDGACGGNV